MTDTRLRELERRLRESPIDLQRAQRFAHAIKNSGENPTEHKDIQGSLEIARSRLERDVNDTDARGFFKSVKPLLWTGFLIAEPSVGVAYQKMHVVEPGREIETFDACKVFNGHVCSIALTRHGLFLGYRDSKDFKPKDYVKLLTEEGLSEKIQGDQDSISSVIPWEDFETYATRYFGSPLNLMVKGEVACKRPGFPIYSAGDYFFAKDWEFISRCKGDETQLIADRGGREGRNVAPIILKDGICFVYDNNEQMYLPRNPENPEEILNDVQPISTVPMRDSRWGVPGVESNSVSQYSELIAGFANARTWQHIWQLPITEIDALRKQIQRHK